MIGLFEQLANWRGFRVLVVGDFMLDELVYGDAERLTGDAPVPILEVRREERLPGGAANVCVDLIALHAQVEAFGIVGDDEPGRRLIDELTRAGVGCDGIVPDAERPTTVKRNMIGLAQHRHPQKMFRVDYESRASMAENVRDLLLSRIEHAIERADAVAIEDYGKGVCDERVCQRIIELCKAKNKPVFVDPARLSDYSRYRGATVMTPNRSEAELATGISSAEGPVIRSNEPIARALHESLELDATVLTLDRHGALLLAGADDPVHVQTVARQVYDVTGAGDMVLAALIAARCNNLSWIDAVRFANAAAGLEVEVFGVRPIPFERVYQAILHEGRELIGKRRTLEEATIEVSASRREGNSIVFTNGCFDILHAGHIQLLRKARSLGDVLVIGVNSDSSVTRLKGEGRPVHKIDDRCAILSELESVAIVVAFEDDTPMTLLEALKPDVLVKGGDYTREGVVGGDFVESYGGRVEIVGTLEGRSTTGAIEKLGLQGA